MRYKWKNTDVNKASNKFSANKNVLKINKNEIIELG